MKVLLFQLRYYTEVVFPRLSEEYNWKIHFTPQFKQLLWQTFCINGRYATRRQLSDMVKLCKDIASNPTIINEVL